MKSKPSLPSMATTPKTKAMLNAKKVVENYLMRLDNLPKKLYNKNTVQYTLRSYV